MRTYVNAYPFSCSELVTITNSAASDGESIAGNLEEIGSRNARVLVDSLLPDGAQVLVKTASHCLKGRVISSTFEPHLGYYVDVKLDPGSRWSLTWFKPQHLLPTWNLKTHAHACKREETVAA
jgi:hypothetical protein